jgi:hypothetical protein
MLQAPWDDRLWSLLSTTPEEVNSAVINENLANRKKFRLDQERIVPADDPALLFPPAGEWSGEYQNMPCVANQEHEVKCKITFRADGAVVGLLTCKDGDFNIRGSYNLSTGIVAWSQFPVDPRPNAKATEFYGDVYNLASGPSRITGTFLTQNGKYCALNLINPLAGEVKEALPALLTGSKKASRTATPVKQEKSGLSAPDLPTLLAGKLQPITDGKPVVYKGMKFVSSYEGGLLVG